MNLKRLSILFSAIAPILLAQCPAPPTNLYLLNKYPRPVTVTFEFRSPEVMADLLEMGGSSSNGGLLQNQGLPVHPNPIASEEKSPSEFLQVNAVSETAFRVVLPGNSHIRLGGLPYGRYRLEADCAGHADFANLHCDAPIYALASLTVETPDGTVRLTDFQIARAFRRIESDVYIFALDPELPELKPEVPGGCLGPST